MATWAALTQEQRDVYQAFERDLRAAHGTFHRLLNTFTELDTMYNAQILAILTDLDDNTVVPNSSGLAGSASLDSDADMVTLVSHMQQLLTGTGIDVSGYNTTGHRNLRNKAAGLNAP